MKQRDAILKYLKAGHPLTALEALHWFGSLRLAARIAELREAGYHIKSQWVKAGKKRYSSYRMA